MTFSTSLMQPDVLHDNIGWLVLSSLLIYIALTGHTVSLTALPVKISTWGMASTEMSYNGRVALGLGGETYEKGTAVTV